MLTYAGIILAVLKLIQTFVQYGQENKWISEGEDKAIAKASAEILRKSQYAKQALEEFAAKSDAAVDDFLRELEPGAPDHK